MATRGSSGTEEARDEGVQGENSSGEQPTSSNHPTISSLGPRLDFAPTFRQKMLVKYSNLIPSNSKKCLKSMQKHVRRLEAFLGCQTGLADDGVTWLCEDISTLCLFTAKTSGESRGPLKNPLEFRRSRDKFGLKMPQKSWTQKGHLRHLRSFFKLPIRVCDAKLQDQGP